MQLDHIALDKLEISKLNMRHGNAPPNIDDILPSVRKVGVLVPPLVRRMEAGDSFEIVAGRRRYFAARTIAEEQGGEYGPLPCAIMDEGDDAAALEASLLENMARLDPDPMTQYETFVQLIKEGQDLGEIAVKQRLALGNLVPKIRTAYRDEAIDDNTVRLLTMATKQQQRAWWKLFESDDQHAPLGRHLKQWLLNGDDIRTDVAIFPLENYKGKLAGDLFEDASYFADPKKFWKLQNEAIAAKGESYFADGWSDVEILGPGSFFSEWRYEKASKKDGGRVYFVVAHSGEVDVHEGYLTNEEARKRQRAKERTERGETAEKPTRPEITKAMVNYLELHRRTAVTAELLGQRDLALRLLAAHVIAGSTLWRIEPEPQKADKDITAESLAASTAMAALKKERDEVLALLDLEASETLIQQGWGDPTALDLFAKLCQLKTDDVVRVLTYAMAESLEAGSPLVEALGTMLDIDMATYWQPDDAFWALLQGRATVNAVLADVAGKPVADQNITGRLAAQKDIARDCLGGTNGRAKVESWLPRYMRFPFEAYTDNGGIRIEQASELAKNPAAAN